MRVKILRPREGEGAARGVPARVPAPSLEPVLPWWWRKASGCGLLESKLDWPGELEEPLVAPPTTPG